MQLLPGAPRALAVLEVPLPTTPCPPQCAHSADAPRRATPRCRVKCALRGQVAAHARVEWNCARFCLGGACPAADPVRGACACRPDRVGVACETHLLRDHLHLPPPGADADAGAGRGVAGSGPRWPGAEGGDETCPISTGGVGEWDAEEFQAALAALARAQSPDACASRDVMVRVPWL